MATKANPQYQIPQPRESGILNFLEFNSENLFHALQHVGWECRYNVRGQWIEFRRTDDAQGPNDGWLRRDDLLYAHLRAIVRKWCFIDPEAGKHQRKGRKRPFWGKTDTETGYEMSALARHRREDPFKVWLDALPEWDGQYRLNSFLTDMFGAADDNPLVEWASRYIFLGAVHRTMEPGCKLDEVPVLIGDQDLGKSHVLQSIFPPSHQTAWFADGLDLSGTEKAKVESLQGRVLVECPELTGMGRAEIERLKAFITRVVDTVRLSYRRDGEDLPRRCVIVGTTNEMRSLPNDPSGNRRFVPVVLKHGCDVAKWMDEHREQLWAEASALYRHGDRANLPRNLKTLQREHNRHYRRRDDVLEDKLLGLDWNPGPVALEGKLTMAQIVQQLDLTGSMAYNNRLATALRAIGCTGPEERKFLGKKVRLWSQPPDDDVLFGKRSAVPAGSATSLTRTGDNGLSHMGIKKLPEPPEPAEPGDSDPLTSDAAKARKYWEKDRKLDARSLRMLLLVNDGMDPQLAEIDGWLAEWNDNHSIARGR